MNEDILQKRLKEKRNKRIVSMFKRGYPQEYIAGYFGISKGRVSQIIKSCEE